MSETKTPVEEQVLTLFRELVAGRVGQLSATTAVPDAQAVIAKALCDEHSIEAAQEIAFHLTDWNADAAFIVAVLLFPERFTPEQIRDGVLRFVMHAPNHAAAAAKLCGCPVSDVFEVGALDADDEAPACK